MKETDEDYRNKQFSKSDKIYIGLGGFFIGALLLTNLIAGKFFQFHLPFTGITWSISCGVIVYPFTFIVTDVVSEIYGKSKANLLVKIGFAVSVFAFLILLVANYAPISPNSPVSEQSFQNVFGITPSIIFGSMIAYLTAQFVDVRLFEYLRELTNGKHLWLRNNGSTIFSQLVDTSLVILVVFLFYPTITGQEVKSFEFIATAILAQYVFKILIALFDTPLIYLTVHFLKKNVK